MPNELLHSPADVLAAHLVASELGTAPSGVWPVYVNDMADIPDQAISVSDTEGLDHGRLMPTGEAAGHKGFQIRVRAKTKNAAWLRADAIRNWLTTIYGATVHVDSSNYTIGRITTIGKAIYNGRERPPSARPVYSINAMIDVTQD